MSTPVAAGPCGTCHHDFDSHTMYLLSPEKGLGMILCPVRGCHCGGTASISGRISSREEITEARTIARQILQDAGMPLPRFLQ